MASQKLDPQSQLSFAPPLTQPSPPRPGKGAQSPLLCQQSTGGALRAMFSQRVQPCALRPCQCRPARSRQGRRGEEGAKDRAGGCVCPHPTQYMHQRVWKLFKGNAGIKDHLSLQAPSGEQHLTGMSQALTVPPAWVRGQPRTRKHLLCGWTPTGSLWDKDRSPALLAASCSSQSRSCYSGQYRTQEVQSCSGNGCRNDSSLSPQPALCVSQGRSSSRGPAPGRAGGQWGACRSTGAQGAHISAFLLLHSCSRQVSSSCHEGEEPQRQHSEKTGFYSSCAAHSHSLETLSCQSYYETNQVPDSGLALPHPQESQHCTKLYLQGKQSEMARPKNPLAIQKKTFKTSVTATPSPQTAPHWLLPGLL